LFVKVFGHIHFVEQSLIVLLTVGFEVDQEVGDQNIVFLGVLVVEFDFKIIHILIFHEEEVLVDLFVFGGDDLGILIVLVVTDDEVGLRDTLLAEDLVAS